MIVRGSLSRAEVVAFLEAQTIPVRLACQTPAGHLWMLSLWYRPVIGDDEDASEGVNGGSEDDGGSENVGESGWTLECATAASADVVTYLRENPAVAFEISTNDPPYAGVRGRGRTTVEPDPEKSVLRSLLKRYLGDTDSDLARTLLREDREEVTIAIDPVVVYGWDFSGRM
jgi:hypothetical protein